MISDWQLSEPPISTVQIPDVTRKIGVYEVHAVLFKLMVIGGSALCATRRASKQTAIPGGNPSSRPPKLPAIESACLMMLLKTGLERRT
mmetsp:Transcript_48196/g.66959  ORF Transcript_48196/g.66959 Transcript_48196/m.66959 type:complete len:89 (+) Transcript_48196:290-556(+)